MRTCLIIICLASLLGFPLLAQGNGEIAEKISTLDGIVTIQPNPDGKATLYLLTDSGAKVQIMLSEEAKAQLQIQDRERIQIEGVFLGATTQTRIQEKVFARMVIRNQKRLSVANPVQLSEQERVQLQIYEKTQLSLNVQTMTQNHEAQGNGSEHNGGSDSGQEKGKK